jgi:TolB-like protein/cytochrome c-type biogenesis protein CcmH/NrfG
VQEFLERIRQRKLVQWALAYVAAAFAFIQVFDIVAQRFGWPEQSVRFVIIALAVGFFVTLVLAWYHGERGAQRVTGTELLIIALLLTIGGGIVWRIGPSAGQLSATAGEVTSTPAQTTTIPHKSIAVLPFTDLSPGHDQEYFSDGMAEEILNALAKVKDLKVAGRTSSFSFKGKNEDLREIGKALAVANVLEGSVRKQGDKVRITAQLIKADDGYHLWSETYDGDLTDVFALQERIARAITEKLEVALQGDAIQPLVPVATNNPEAYALYLQASRIFNRREGPRFSEAIAQLEQAIKLDPKFARAHSRLAAMMAVAPTYIKIDAVDAATAVEEHARSASEIDPSLAEPYAALGQMYSARRRFVEGRVALERAMALDPTDETTAFWYAASLIMTGYYQRGNESLDQLLAVDPMMPIAMLWRGLDYAYDGDIAHAEPLLQRLANANLRFAGLGLSFVASARGRHDEAVTYLASGLAGVQFDLPSSTFDVLAKGILGDAADRAAALAAIDQYLSGAHTINGVMAHALIRLGEPARALAITRDRPSGNDAAYLGMLWTPLGQKARTLPQFPEYVRQIGMTAVWDRYGEPDLCRKQPSGDYVCH